jgi:hypothetical protein
MKVIDKTMKGKEIKNYVAINYLFQGVVSWQKMGGGGLCFTFPKEGDGGHLPNTFYPLHPSPRSTPG